MTILYRCNMCHKTMEWVDFRYVLLASDRDFESKRDLCPSCADDVTNYIDRGIRAQDEFNELKQIESRKEQPLEPFYNKIKRDDKGRFKKKNG